MKRFIDVHRGEIMAGQGEVVLKSDTNSACLVIAAYDTMKKIGCLAHAMFSPHMEDAMNHEEHKEARRTIGNAIDEMVKDMTLLGANQDNIEVRLVTGENIPHEKDDPDYNKNISSAVECLQQHHLRCAKDAKRDAGNLHVSLDVESGSILYS